MQPLETMNSVLLNYREICEGCLGMHRELSVIAEEDLKCFIEILDNLEPINYPPLLCSECASTLRKVLEFKTQVKSAHYSLLRSFNEKNQVKCCSGLVTCNDTNCNFDEAVSNSIQDQCTIITDANTTNQSVIKGKEKEKHISISRLKKVASNENEIQPVTFIKIEGGDEVQFSCDTADVLYQKCDNLEQTENGDVRRPILKEPFGIQRSPSSRIEEKCENIQKYEDNSFNESDDEPLCALKSIEPANNGESRTRKKRDRPKIKERKQKGCKSEKPGGVIRNSRVTKTLRDLNMGSDRLEMVILTWEEVEQERQRALQSAAFLRQRHRCGRCALGFNHRAKLDNHMRKHDASGRDSSAVCTVCGVVCRDARALASHTRRHRLRWRCRECGATWSRAAVAADHLARAHRGPAPTHTCHVCGHTERTLGKLRVHLKSHAERQKCEQCGKTFRDKASLNTHLFIHKGEKEYQCPECDKSFLFKRAMEIHLVTHNPSSLLYCRECDMNFKNQMSYYQHMKYNLKHVHPDKLKHACGWCPKRFVKESRLREHRAAVHLHDTPERCQQPGCDFACASKPVLRAHVRSAHRPGPAPGATPTPARVCDACGKTYKTKKSLEDHLRKHTGERPFQCKQCPSTFGYQAALYNHNKLVHLKLKRVRASVADSVHWTDVPAPAHNANAGQLH